MKKFVVSVLALFVLFSGTAFATDEVPKDLSVVVNGVEIASQSPHFIRDGKTYVSVEAFTELFGHIGYDSESGEVNGYKLGDTIVRDGIVFAWVKELAKAVQAQSVQWDEQNREVYILALPPEIVPLHEESVPGMGIHYANPQDMAAGGPVYCVFEGKLYCVEYILPTSLVDSMASTVLEAMKGYPSPAVVETAVDYNGNPGLEFEHYTFHLYFYSADDRSHITGAPH